MKTLINAQQPSIGIRIFVTCQLFTFLFLIPHLVNGQCYRRYEPDTSAPRIRNVVFTTPVSRNTTINGLALGFQPVRWHGARTLNINGISVSASPTDPLFCLITLFASIDIEPKSSTYPKDAFSCADLYPDADTAHFINSAFNGLILGCVTPGAVKSNGVNISAIVNASYSMKGLSIGLFNHHYSFKGVLIAGLRNKTTTGRGVQIGFFNRCKEGKVLQIGLLNKIGKRTIPFVNFRF